MSENYRVGKITFTQGLPIEVSEESEQSIGYQLTEDQKRIVHQVGSTVKAYLKAAEELLNDKYASIKHWAPVHLRDCGNVLVACCEDGVIIRYDQKIREEKKGILTAWFMENLPQLAPAISQSVVFCHNDKNFSSSIPTNGVELSLSITRNSTGQTTGVLKAKIGFEAVINRPNQIPIPPSKPYCLLSVQDSLEIELLGEMVKEGVPTGKGQQFLARTPVRLPVGWKCIEVFPFFNLDYWKPEFAQVWAERDILASVVTKQLREAQLHTLDPKAEARKQLSKLIKAYKDLLDSNPEREEILQGFLKENPILLCPTHTKVWPKLPLGSRETDFVFREATDDYLLVELEKSTHPLFLKNGHTSRELNRARGQILDWKRYIEDNLATVQRELGLSSISANPKSLIVIGRSHSLTPENRRKLITLENVSPTIKIMTYDDILENTKAVVENLLGPL